MFEEYLKDYHAEHDGSMILDDDLSDAFDAWLVDLDVEDWIRLGDQYMDEKCASYLGKRSAAKRDTSSETMKQLRAKRK